jgi:ParB family chromosome partitioning protein
MPSRRGLGKGLDALIPGSELPADRKGVLKVPISAIQPNPLQPRRSFETEGLHELADSIRQHGILQPLIVSQSPAGGYLLVVGERRWHAAEMAGLAEVPVIVRQVSDQERLELALIENLQRTDLNPVEAAEGYQQLVDQFKLSHEQIAAQVGKSRSTVSNTLRLLKLGPAVLQALASGRISEGHGRALLGLASPQSQSAALQTIETRGLNVRQTEDLVRRLSGQRRKPKPSVERPAEEGDLEQRLQQSLGTRVILKRGQHGGSIVIRFFSDEELNSLIDRLLGSSPA